MSNLIEKQCTLLIPYNSPIGAASSEADLIRQLESTDDELKIATLKQVIVRLLNGEQFPKMLMAVIKYTTRSENHTIKKLSLIYWEIAERKGPDGRLLSEMILICDALKGALTHANEFVRGNTLRFLTKVKDREIIESLVPAVTANLSHRHSYVRKYAVQAVHSIYVACADLVPDAPELIEAFLFAEYNPAAKRNALLFLLQCDHKRAIGFLNSVLPTVHTLGDATLLVVLELVRKIVATDAGAKGQYLRCVHGMLTQASAPVAFEAANTLIALTAAPTAVRAAVAAYCRLLLTEGDHNVKLIVLGRLVALKRRFGAILHDALPDILRSLQTPNAELRKQAVALALDLVSAVSVDAVATALRKELTQTVAAIALGTGREYNTAAAAALAGADAVASPLESYRSLLSDALHRCCVRFPAIVPAVAPTLIAHLADDAASSALDVVLFVREVFEEHAALRAELVPALLNALGQIRTADAFRGVLWILGEYTGVGASGSDILALPESVALVKRTLVAVLDAVGPLPLPSTAVAEAAAANAAASAGSPTAAAAAAAATAAAEAATSSSDSPLRTRLCASDPFLACALCACVAKLLLRLRLSAAAGFELLYARGLHLLVSVLLVASPPSPPPAEGALAAMSTSAPPVGDAEQKAALSSSRVLEHDSMERILLYVRLLMGAVHDANALQIAQTLLAQGRAAYRTALHEQRARQAAADKSPSAGFGMGAAAAVATHTGGEAAADPEQATATAAATASGIITTTPAHKQSALARAKAAAERPEGTVELEDIITVRQLRKGADASAEADSDGAAPGASTYAVDTEADIALAVQGKSKSSLMDLAKLDKIVQLTGYGDAVYVEAQITVLEYDVMMDVTFVNQTSALLQNVHLELHTSPDLKVVDRPAPFALEAHGVVTLQCALKVVKTESGTIVGNVSYDNARGTDKSVVSLNAVQIDIIDYIVPATCTDAQYRAMWAEYGWENKLGANTDITDLGEYLAHVVATTNMRCITPPAQLSGGCSFLSANLYARSIFGEDALMNVSVEKTAAGTITGYLRIRAKTQDIALGLGEKIDSCQRTKTSSAISAKTSDAIVVE